MNIDTMPPYDFIQGALIPIDKPLRWTSFDVVNKLRFSLKQHLNIKKIKVGHTGTLDPLATGLLMIATGKMTKSIPSLTGLTKNYEAQIQFGISTPSYDSETLNEHVKHEKLVNLQDIEKTIPMYVGEILQQVPIYSAVKKNGKRMYEYARKDIPVTPPTKQVKIHEIHIKSFDKAKQVCALDIYCGSGTYIRSLAHDLGKSLGGGAYLSTLKRTAVGNWQLDQSFSVDEFIRMIQDDIKN